MPDDHIRLGKLMQQPPPFQFTGVTGSDTVTPQTPLPLDLLNEEATERLHALQAAMHLVGDRDIVEILQAAHWIVEGDVITLEEGDTNEGIKE